MILAFLNFSKIVLKSRYSYNFKTIFLTVFIFFCLIKNRANSSKQSASPSTKLFRTQLKKINVFHRIIKKNQNKNFVKKINHEYFGGSDVMNVSMDMCSPVKAVKSFVYEKNPAFHYSLEPRGSKKGRKS